MSELRLKDGTGSGATAKVDRENRLLTQSINVTETAQRSIDGFGFNLNTGRIAIPNGADNAVLYFKYTGTKTYFLTGFVVGIGTLASPTDSAYVTLLRNPTAGTIVTNAVAADISGNLNFASPNQLPGDFYKGDGTDAFTDGEVIASLFAGGSQRLVSPANVLLSPSNSIGINVQLNAAAGGNVYATLIGYEREGV